MSKEKVLTILEDMKDSHKSDLFKVKYIENEQPIIFNAYIQKKTDRYEVHHINSDIKINDSKDDISSLEKLPKTEYPLDTFNSKVELIDFVSEFIV